MGTYTVCNLLPSGTTSPLAFISKAVLVHINDSLSALLGQGGHGLSAVSELVQSTGTIAIHNDIDIIQKLLELFTSGFALQVEVGGVLTHVTINLEEGDIGKTRASDFQDIGAILSQDTCDSRSCNDTAHFQDLDTLKDLLAAVAGGWEWRRRNITWKLADLPSRFLNVKLAL
jgi:hypothetical protein